MHCKLYDDDRENMIDTVELQFLKHNIKPTLRRLDMPSLLVSSSELPKEVRQVVKSAVFQYLGTLPDVL